MYEVCYGCQFQILVEIEPINTSDFSLISYVTLQILRPKKILRRSLGGTNKAMVKPVHPFNGLGKIFKCLFLPVVKHVS